MYVILLEMVISIGILNTKKNFTNVTELYNSLVILILVIYTNNSIKVSVFLHKQILFILGTYCSHLSVGVRSGIIDYDAPKTRCA